VVESKAVGQRSLPGDGLTLLNWNIAKNNHWTNWQRELEAIAHQYKPQLFFFQEARLAPNRSVSFFDWDVARAKGPDPAGLTELAWHFAPNLVDTAGHRFGLLTAAHATTLSHRMFHSEFREPFIATPKVALIAEYPLAVAGSTARSVTLLTVNIHSLNFVSTAQFAAQLTQVEAAISHHLGPVIFAGDFNTWRAERMDWLEACMARLGLSRVIFDEDSDRQLKRFLRSDPLDHVFYRGLSLLPEKTRVIGTANTSDHKPMVVSFRIDPERSPLSGDQV